jgi:hypothetical protein
LNNSKKGEIDSKNLRINTALQENVTVVLAYCADLKNKYTNHKVLTVRMAKVIVTYLQDINELG